MLTDMLSIRRRDRLVDFLLGHPVDSHGIARRSDCAIPSTRDLHKILPFASLSVVILALVEGVDLGVRLVWDVFWL